MRGGRPTVYYRARHGAFDLRDYEGVFVLVFNRTTTESIPVQAPSGVDVCQCPGLWVFGNWTTVMAPYTCISTVSFWGVSFFFLQYKLITCDGREEAVYISVHWADRPCPPKHPCPKRRRKTAQSTAVTRTKRFSEFNTQRPSWL